jgi:hypothetical protein
VKHIVFVISLLLLFSATCLYAQTPIWQLISEQNISSFDMLTTRSGLIGIDDNGTRVLSRYDFGAINGIFSVSGSITSIIISDANIAYFTVKGDGIYEANNGWSNFVQLIPVGNSTLLAVRRPNMLANFGANLEVSNDGLTFQNAAGISVKDTVSAADFFSSGTCVAVTGTKLYRSLDGGKNWFVILDTLVNTNSIYIDHTHNAIYLGGSNCMKSLDSGATWQTLSSIFFTLAGDVVGSRDCSGTFYIAPDAATHGAMYRSIDQGKFFQEAGPAIFSSVSLRKGVVLDRGSTFFWLDSSGLIGVIRDGVDGVVTDSVSDRIQIQIDSGVSNSLCPNASAMQFGVSVSYDQCTSIILDSLKQVSPAPSFSAKLIPGSLTNAVPKRIACSFHAVHIGGDTAHYELSFHSPVTSNVEHLFFDIVGMGIAGSPELQLTSTELDFPSTGIDSSHQISLTISNPGCANLVIDTIVTTNPAIFGVSTKNFPINLNAGKSMQLMINFSPHLEGDYLETLELQTNIGNRNITLRGTGTPKADVLNASVLINNITIYPNPTNNYLTILSLSPLPKNIFIFDLLGREVLDIQTAGNTKITSDLSILPSGIYALDCGSGKFERIVIRH